jgi:myo-inositol-1(or 4)-monophosphatase
LQASDAPDLAALRRHVAASVREAGELALRSFRSPIKSWFKEGNSPVSEADLAVDALLRERLLATGLPSGWLSEETEDDPRRLSADHVWIVDPIDGTRGFLAGLPDWTISIALAAAGRPVLAALYAPATDELFLATAGGGATRNGEPIAVTQGHALADARAAGPDRRLGRLAPFGIVALPKVHSLALRIARVADGTLDLALAGPNSHDWDLAAADLLVHEAGGALTTLGGETVVYNKPIPTHGALFAAGHARHKALSELMRQGRVAFG